MEEEDEQSQAASECCHGRRGRGGGGGAARSTQWAWIPRGGGLPTSPLSPRSTSELASTDATGEDSEEAGGSTMASTASTKEPDFVEAYASLRKASSLNCVAVSNLQEQQRHCRSTELRPRFWKTLEVRYGSETELRDPSSQQLRRPCTSSYFVHIRAPKQQPLILEEEGDF